MNLVTPSASQLLYLRVRAGFIQQGRSLSAYCRDNGIHPTNARHALVGSWDGPKGRKLRAHLIEASGISATRAAADEVA